MTTHMFRINGRVVDAIGHRGVGGLLVEAWDKNLFLDDTVGAAVTDKKGWFHIEIDSSYLWKFMFDWQLFFDRRPDLYFKVFHGHKLIRDTKESILWNINVGETAVTIEVDQIEGPPDHEQKEHPYIVKGRVRQADATPLAYAKVRAFDKDLRQEQPLGEAATDAEGRYEIRYKAEQFRRAEKARADLIVRAYDSKNEVLVASPVLFNARRVQVVNQIVGNGSYQGPSEYERVAAQLRPLLEDLAPADLTEDDEAFLAGETGLDSGKIHFFAVAARLSKQTDIVPEAFYGFLHQGLPEDLPGLLTQSRATHRRALEAALQANIVPLTLKAKIDEILDRLQRLVVDQAFQPPAPSQQPPIGTLLDTSPLKSEAQRRDFIDRYVRHDGPVEAFWKTLRTDPDYKDVVDDIQFTLQLGVYTQNNPPLVQRLQVFKQEGKITDLRDLAKFDEEAWLAILAESAGPNNAIPIPPDVPGQTPEERTANYARVLTRLAENAFPTTAIAYRLSKDPHLPGKEDLTVFFVRNREFDFGTGTVNGYLAATEGALEGISDPPGTVQRLKGLERLYKLTPRYAEMRVLAAAGLDSSYAVTRLSENAFIDRYSGALGGPARAKRMYHNAAQVSALGMHLLATYAPLFNRTSMAVLPYEPVDEPGLPDWESLFGSLDLCACEHCRSVLSPAAYLVDILTFLRHREAAIGAPNPKDVLFLRRSDLGEIELTCENTNTLLPYIDLVNEILEQAVAPATFILDAGFASDLDNALVSDRLRAAFRTKGFPLSASARIRMLESGWRWHVMDLGWRFPVSRQNGVLTVAAVPQTTGTPEELAANPEHIHPAAYDTLRQQVYPWGLPFDLWAEEARTYLAHLGVPRHVLMRILQQTASPSEPSDVAIAGEVLGLTTVERQIITDTHPDATAAPWRFWGFAEEGTWVDDLKTVRTLLDRSGLSYTALAELLKLRFIALDGPLEITSTDPTTCDTRQLQVPSLTKPALGRIHRFERLRVKLGWTALELDKAITALKPAGLDDAFLLMLTQIEALRADLKLPLVALFAWYARIDTAAYPATPPSSPNSLYEDLFQNPAVIKLASGEPDLFALNDARTELATIRSLVIADTDTEPQKAEKKALRTALCGALQLAEIDLSLLVDGPAAVITGDRNLTLENLSRLYRHAALARALRLTIEDLLGAKALIGLDPFVTENVPATPADVVRTLNFIEKIRKIRAADFTIAGLSELLRQGAIPAAGGMPSEETMAVVLDALRAGLKKIAAEAIAAPDPQGEQTAARLAVLGWDAMLVRQAVDTIGGRVTYAEPLDPWPTGLIFPEGSGASYDPKAKVLTFAGAMTLAEQTTLLALSGDAAYQAAVNRLFDLPRRFVREQMKTFVAPVFTAPLGQLPTTLQFPASLADRISYNSDTRQLCFVGTMTEGEQTTLLALSGDAAYQAAVKALAAAPTTYVPPEENSFLAKAADAAGLFDTAKPAQERYADVLAKVNEYLKRSSSESLIKQTLSDTVKLDVALAEWLLTQWSDIPTTPAHRAMQEFRADAFIDSSDKITPARFPTLFRTFLLLHKTASIISRLHITLPELKWLIDNAVRLGWLAFNTLPTTPTAPPVSFDGWERLVDVFRWRAELPPERPSAFELLGLALSATGDGADALKTQILDGWSRLAAWPMEDLEALLGRKTSAADCGLLGYRLPLAANGPNDYKDERTWLQLREVFAVLKRLGTHAATARDWAKPDLSANDVQSLRQTVKAKYEPRPWLEIARPLRDALREKQRAALVAYLVAHPDPGRNQNWKDANELYGHFLIDVEMSPCMMTSRIKQAISSVQLFVQRCLMNLEQPSVSANAAIDSKWREWKWMKNYRVWEAARKIFLWPENWIEPELRDGKSPFFKDLENELLQSEVTPETAEAALLNYLEKLDDIAQLEVVAVYHQHEIGSLEHSAIDVLHVFARSQGVSPIYYYRQRVDGAYWTAWEKMDVDIAGRQLLPVLWNRRLYLFWPLFFEVADEQPISMPEPGKQIEKSRRYWKTQLAWTELKNRKWAPKQITETTATIGSGYEKGRILLESQIEKSSDLIIALQYITSGTEGYGASFDPSFCTYTHNLLKFRFSGCRTKATLEKDSSSGLDLDWCRLPAGTYPTEMGYDEKKNEQEADVNPLVLLADGDAFKDVTTLNKTPGAVPYRLCAERFPDIDPNEPLFFADGRRSYFIMPEKVSVFEYDHWGSPGWARPSQVQLDWVGQLPGKYYLEADSPHYPIGPNVRATAPILVEDTFSIEEIHAGAAQSMPVDAAAATVSEGVVAGTVIARSSQSSLEVLREKYHREEAYAAVPTAFGHYIVKTHYRFVPFYHPYTCKFIRVLRRDGIDGVMQRSLQLERDPPLGSWSPTDFYHTYGPSYVVDSSSYPVDEVDFSYGGAYSSYNWELFFHIPLLIADRLSKNQKFEEAQKWFHYIFDPTDTSHEPKPNKYWQLKHFFNTSHPDYQKQEIRRLLRLLAEGSTDPDLVNQVHEWRESPFNPHLIARLRTTAYQKTVVQKYLDNLIAWGDQLSRQGTIESVNEATQLYVLAAEILGRRPEEITPRQSALACTFSEMEPKLDEVPRALVAMESLAPAGGDGVIKPVEEPPLTLPALLYFCVPSNDKLLAYWDTVAERLRNIRYCLLPQPPLWESPIEPGLLVRAAAAGVDITSALSDINAALPPYRFTTMMQKARELCEQVRSFGTALFAALERRDAEALALLRSTQEIAVLTAVRQVKQQQIDEAAATLQGLQHAQQLATLRKQYYETIPFMNPAEQANLIITGQALRLQASQMQMDYLANALCLIPDVKVGCPTTIGATLGGSGLGGAMKAMSGYMASMVSMMHTTASMSATMGGYQRRANEWDLQKRLATKEVEQIGKQITAAEIRKAIADQDLKNHDRQIDNAKAVDDFMRTKFTNSELHGWMVGELSTLYFRSYQLAYDMAKRAERCFRHELGVTDSGYIRFGYWDSLKKGLLSGERLAHDLSRMEAAYLDQNRREYELAKTVSLALLDPVALLRLKQTGECFITLPEAIFDLDHPGHYMRRLKTMSVTIPCVAGPYTGVHCTLTLIRGSVRKDATLSGGTGDADGYVRNGQEDSRFLDNVGPLQSIATSTAQNDSGLFELNFRDERYLPFEGQGAVDSEWRIQLNPLANRFDFATITDVLLQLRYTAREGGEPLKKAAQAALPKVELQLLSARYEFADAWHRFLHPADNAESQSLTLNLQNRFVYQPNGGKSSIKEIMLFLKVKEVPINALPIPLELYDNKDGNAPNLLEGISLTSVSALNGLYYATKDLSGTPKVPGEWLIRIQGSQLPDFLTQTVTVGGTIFKHLKAEGVEDLYIVCRLATA